MNLKSSFFFQYKVAQFEYKMVINLNLLKTPYIEFLKIFMNNFVIVEGDPSLQ